MALYEQFVNSVRYQGNITRGKAEELLNLNPDLVIYRDSSRTISGYKCFAVSAKINGSVVHYSIGFDADDQFYSFGSYRVPVKIVLPADTELDPSIDIALLKLKGSGTTFIASSSGMFSSSSPITSEIKSAPGLGTAFTPESSSADGAPHIKFCVLNPDDSIGAAWFSSFVKEANSAANNQYQAKHNSDKSPIKPFRYSPNLTKLYESTLESDYVPLRYKIRKLIEFVEHLYHPKVTRASTDVLFVVNLLACLLNKEVSEHTLSADLQQLTKEWNCSEPSSSAAAYFRH